jgi:iron complex transport system substrate-binding protein
LWGFVRGFRLIALALALALAGPAAARPERVVSMNPCVDAVLLAVADPGQVAGISHWSHERESASAPLDLARRFPVHGGTAEEVIALRPDLVFVTPFTPLATRTAFSRLGIATVSVGVPAGIGESLAQVQVIADAVGQGARGARLVDEVGRALAASKRAGARPALMRMSGGFVPGPGSLSEALMAHAGLRSVAAGYGLKGAGRLGLEPLLLDPPPLLITDRPEAVPPLLTRQGVPVAAFDRRLLNCGGSSLAPAARRLAAIRDGQK